jgi:hypothetical protein
MVMPKIITVMILILLISISLSGCTQEKNSPVQQNEITIIDYNATTFWTTSSKSYNHSGFYHGFSDDSYHYYLINGTVKNEAGNLTSFSIIADLYDSTNNILPAGNNPDVINEDTLYDVPDTAIMNFSIRINDYQYFKQVSSVRFRISMI